MAKNQAIIDRAPTPPRHKWLMKSEVMKTRRRRCPFIISSMMAMGTSAKAERKNTC